jgi:lysozyme family protein
MADLNCAFQRTMQFEGGYSQDPDDPGGETYKGISRPNWPQWEGWPIVDRLRTATGFPANLERDAGLQDSVRGFYRRQFWNRLKGDDIPDQTVAEELFDAAVNVGHKTAATWLQQGLNVLNRNGALYAEIAGDGVIGPRTLNALRAYLQNDQPGYLLKAMVVQRGMHYLTIMLNKPTQRKFARGWLARVGGIG